MTGAQNSLAGVALLNTQLSAATCALSWMCAEWAARCRPTLLGVLSGAVAGLVAITPAAGYVDTTGAFFIGLLSGPFCYYGAQLKHRLGFDDALDGFGIHSLGGISGGVLLGFFATDRFNPKGRGVFYGGGGAQLANQVLGVVVSCAWSCALTYLLLLLVDRGSSLRAVEEELDGNALDYSLRGDAVAVAVDPPQQQHNNFFEMPRFEGGGGLGGDDLDSSMHGDYDTGARGDEEDDALPERASPVRRFRSDEGIGVASEGQGQRMSE